MSMLSVKIRPDNNDFGGNLPDEEIIFHDVAGYELEKGGAHGVEFFCVKKNDGSVHAVRSYKVVSFTFTKE